MAKRTLPRGLQSRFGGAGRLGILLITAEVKN